MAVLVLLAVQIVASKGGLSGSWSGQTTDCNAIASGSKLKLAAEGFEHTQQAMAECIKVGPSTTAGLSVQPMLQGRGHTWHLRVWPTWQTLPCHVCHASVVSVDLVRCWGTATVVLPRGKRLHDNLLGTPEDARAAELQHARSRWQHAQICSRAACSVWHSNGRSCSNSLNAKEAERHAC